MRKLLSKSVLLAVLTAILLTMTAWAAEDTEGTVSVTALRLRTEPSTDSATITYLNSGDQVQILGEAGEWYQVSCGQYTGYVYAAYVESRGSQSVSADAAQESLAGKRGVVTANEVNFLNSPSADGEALATLEQGAEVTILNVLDTWCKVERDGQEGYVSGEYLSVDGLPLVDPRGVITGSCVNVRSIPSTDGSILTKVYAGNMVDLLSLEDNWYAVSVNGTKGYICADYVRVYTPGAAGTVGAEAAEAAYDYLGVRYVYGGASPKGFDCSGFTMYIYGLLGYSLPHSATSQWQSTGTYVEREDLQPGDLVLFCDPSLSKGKACSHVGIYVGDGEFIHASSSSTGYVKVSSLSESYYTKYYVGAKRVA